MKRVLLLFVILLCVLTATKASETDKMQDFESLLDNVSDIATKKSLNVDYLPSVVTIIDAQTYVDSGIENIGEAIGMLPGIQMQLSSIGYTMTTVRGFKNPNAYLSDKIKILVDGVAINNEVSGSSSFYMDFPMQLVDKIEVLRGPNSTREGSGAFYGTVNIITKLGSTKAENRVYVGAGSYETFTAGANVYNISDNWKTYADGYVTQNNKSLGVEESSVGTDEKMRDFSVGFKAVNGGFEFLTRYKRSVYGNFYGFEGTMNPIPTNPKEHINSYFFSQASYKTDINNFKLETKVNFSYRELDEGANIQSISNIATEFATVGVTMNDGFYFTKKLKEENYEAEAILTLPKIASNDITAGIGARHAKILEDDYFNSVENAITQNLSTITSSAGYDNFRYRQSNEPAFWANPTTNFIKANTSRTIAYGYLEDLISLTEDVDIILGARVDNYSDSATQISNRAAAVYRANDKTIFKLLYGSAFRAPTFTEAYANGHINYRAGDKNLKPEETDTYEAVAIYTPNFNNKFSLNIYYAILENIIDLEEFQGTIAGYQNFKDRTSRGVEFEYNFNTSQQHNFYFNASYVDADYTTPPDDDSASFYESMPDISKTMFKAIYLYRPTQKLSFGTTWQYYAQTTPTKVQWIVNAASDGDTSVKKMHIFDETLTYRFSSNSQARVTVKNIFNTDVRVPSYYNFSDNGFKREGRNYLFSFVQKF